MAAVDVRVPLDTIPVTPTRESDSAGSSDENTISQAVGNSQVPRPSDGLITVFHDTENFNVKHPLMHEWTLWFTKPPSSKVSFHICTRHLRILVLTKQ